jgi:hypothetical protein
VKEKRTSAAAPILVALVILSVSTVPYVAGYFWLGVPADGLGLYARPRMVRLYPSRWLAEIFRPAAMIESAVTPYMVSTAAASRPEPTTAQ